MIKQLSEHTSITMKQVFDQLKEIDLLDGTQDGKISPASFRLMFGLDIGEPEEVPQQQSEFWICTECSHRNANKLDSCLYCGAKKE